MQTEYIGHVCEDLKRTAATYQLQLKDSQEENRLLKRVGGDNSQELEQLKEEYFKFRQDNLDADTQIRDLTNEWRATSELLDLTKKELEKTRQLLSEEKAQTIKMRSRQQALEGEHRDVAKHVHEYYTVIADLEKKLQDEILANHQLQMANKKSNERFHDFQANEYTKVTKDLIQVTSEKQALITKLKITLNTMMTDRKKLEQQLQDITALSSTENALKQEAQQDNIRLVKELASMKQMYMQQVSQNAKLKFQVNELTEK